MWDSEKFTVKKKQNAGTDVLSSLAIRYMYALLYVVMLLMKDKMPDLFIVFVCIKCSEHSFENSFYLKF